MSMVWNFTLVSGLSCLFVFMASQLCLCETEGVCRQRVFLKAGQGNQPTKHIISTHNARSWIECGHLCLLEEDTCVSFYYKTKGAFQIMNCHLSNDTEASITTIAGGNIDESSWKFFKAIVHCLNNPCKNDGKCVEDGCQAEPFNCVCGVRHEGKFCEIESVFPSCKHILERNSSAQDGIYKINTNTTRGYSHVYCQMTTLPGCESGGWTMVMKMDGTQKTFHAYSHHWRTKTSYNPEGGLTAFDDNETMLATYWSTPFQELCVGMKVANDLRFMSINYTASSLYSSMENGTYYQATAAGRGKWMSLMSNLTLEPQCNLEGFNLQNQHGGNRTMWVRLGILGNNRQDCRSAYSVLGFGSNFWKWGSSCGNSMKVSKNENITATSMGYIFVR